MSNLIENQEGEIITVTARLTRHYKSSSLELGVSVHVRVKDVNDLTRANEQLIEHLQREHKTQLEKLVAQGGAAVQPAAGESSEPLPEGVGIETIGVDSIEVEVKGGKRYYKVFGGKYTKFGVRAWLDPQIIEAVQHLVNFESLPIANNDVKSFRLFAQISMNGDKPVKVLKMGVAPQAETERS